MKPDKVFVEKMEDLTKFQGLQMSQDAQTSQMLFKEDQ